MGNNLHLFLSKAARASIAKSDRLHDAVLNLAQVIDSISDTAAERAEFARDARWLPREILQDADSGGAA